MRPHHVAIALGVAGLVAFAWLFVCMPLTDPDEALFACVARNMFQSSDWIVPIDRGKPFLDRPILHYWLMAGCVRLLGDFGVCYRLPSLACGLATVAFTGLISQVWLGPKRFLPTLMVAGAMPAIGLITVAVGHDSSLVALTVAAIWINVRLLDDSAASRQIGWAVAGGVCVGMALLAKGLLGIVLPTMAIVPFAVVRRRMPLVGWLVQSVVAVTIAAPWYLAIENRVPGTLRYFIFERHFGGYLTSEQRHGENSFLIYLPTLLAGGLPWTLSWMLSVRKQYRSWATETRFTPAEWAVLTWLVTTVGFFCLAGSRNPTYLLPAFVPLAVLVGARMKADRTLAFMTAATIGCEIVFWAAAMPWLEMQRSTRSAVVQLRAEGRPGDQLLWYFHVPPSARYYGPEFSFRRVNAGDLEATPTESTTLVCRESQVDAVAATAFGKTARLLPQRSRYRIFRCDAGLSR